MTRHGLLVIALCASACDQLPARTPPPDEANDQTTSMRVVDYVREELHAPEETRRAPLPVFLMDVPYLLIRGVVPPLRILNEILATGRMGGGMSPGARWSPFQLTESEYQDLLVALPKAHAEVDAAAARFVPEQIRIDPSLAHHTDLQEWARAVAAKYR